MKETKKENEINEKKKRQESLTLSIGRWGKKDE